MDKCVYFTDQFFSSGRTDIYNESQEKLGKLDLKSAFTSSVSVENEKGEIIVKGGFPFLSGKWTIKQPNGKEFGEVRASSFSFFTKRYSYTTNSGRFEIESPAFSKEYTILDENKAEVATLILVRSSEKKLLILAIADSTSFSSKMKRLKKKHL